MDEEIDPQAAPQYPPQDGPQYQPPPPFARPSPPQGYPPPSYPPPGAGHSPGPAGAHPALQGGYAAALGYPPPPPARSNRKVWILVAGVLALIVAGFATVVAVAAGGDDGPPAATHRVRVPDSFAAYQRLESAQARQVEQDMRDRLTTRGKYEARVYAHAQLGIFAAPAQNSPSLYFVGVDGKSSDTVNELLHTNSPAHNADSFLLGAAVSSSSSYSAGAFGGALKCGRDEHEQPLCVWVDRSTLGVLVSIDQTITLRELARATVQLRTAAEY